MSCLVAMKIIFYESIIESVNGEDIWFWRKSRHSLLVVSLSLLFVRVTLFWLITLILFRISISNNTALIAETSNIILTYFVLVDFHEI